MRLSNESKPGAGQLAIRPARLSDIETMRQIEREAGVLFAQIGMHDIAEDEPLPPDNLEVHLATVRRDSTVRRCRDLPACPRPL